MEITNLKYFYTAAKHQHITKAANELHVAQPALTKSIKLLENELGTKLFIKNGRGIKLTETGEYLKNTIEPIIHQLESLPLAIKNKMELEENTISINILAASTIVSDIIIKFKKLHPNIIFKMTQKESELSSDITIVTNTSTPDHYINVKKRGVVKEKIYIAVPKNNNVKVSDNTIDLKDLKTENFIALSGSRRFRPLCDSFCQYAGFVPQVVFESDSLIAVKNFITAGIGVAFWPEFSWGKLDDKNILLYNVKNPVCQREIVVYLRENKKSHISEIFFDFLMKELKK